MTLWLSPPLAEGRAALWGLGAVPVDGDLEQEQGRGRQPVHGGQELGGVGDDGGRHLELGGPFDDLQPAVVHGRLPAPQVDRGVVAVLMEILQEREVAFRRDFLLFQIFEIAAVQEAVVAPLAAGMAAQVAHVGDADGKLTDASGLAGLGPGIEDLEKELLLFQGGQTAGDPGVAGHLDGLFEDSAEGDAAALTHGASRAETANTPLTPKRRALQGPGNGAFRSPLLSCVAGVRGDHPCQPGVRSRPPEASSSSLHLSHPA